MDKQQQTPPAEQRYPDLFSFIDGAVDCFSAVLDVGTISAPVSYLGLVRVSAVMRAYNLLKSIRQLLATDHWENAAILMRSLFELSLNVEEVERDPLTAEEQAERFFRFEVLQRLRLLLAESNYEIATGRRRSHDSRLAALQEAAPRFFGEWVETRKDGTIRWKTNWSGKSVRQLCEASKSPVKMGHYDIVYAYASDMAHSSPRGVLSTFKGANVADWRTFLAKMDESERREVLTVTSLSVLFACEVVALTKFLDRAFDPVKMLLVMERVYQLYGVQPPENRPEIAAAMRAHSAKDRKP